MNDQETIEDIVREIRSAAHIQNADTPESVIAFASRIEAANAREVLAAVKEAGRIHAACVRAGCVHAGEAVCPGGSAPGECDHYATDEGGTPPPARLSNLECLSIITDSHLVARLTDSQKRALLRAVHALARRVMQKERNMRSRAARNAATETEAAND